MYQMQSVVSLLLLKSIPSISLILYSHALAQLQLEQQEEIVQEYQHPFSDPNVFNIAHPGSPGNRIQSGTLQYGELMARRL